MIDSPAALEPLENLRFFAPEIGRNNKRNVLSDGFLGGVAEYPFRSFIPTRDRTVELFADDRIVRGVHDSGQQTCYLLGLFSFGDVELAC